MLYVVFDDNFVIQSVHSKRDKAFKVLPLGGKVGLFPSGYDKGNIQELVSNRLRRGLVKPLFVELTE